MGEVSATVAGGVRPAAVAGMFYPADPDELRAVIAACLAGPVPPGSTGLAGAVGPESSGRPDLAPGSAARPVPPGSDSGSGSGSLRPMERLSGRPADPSAEASAASLAAGVAAGAGAGTGRGAARGAGDLGAVVALVAPKAVIAPHAGYRYSGPTAGSAYRSLLPRRGSVERVVVVGPAHRVRLAGVGISSARAWATPLGDIEVDVATCNDLSEMPGVVVADDAHGPEHSVEVHLPFVQEVFGDVALVPLVVGGADTAGLASVLDAVWGGPETAIVVSSDLSHYLDDATARVRDRLTCTAIVESRPRDIGPHEACGFLPIGGLLTAALARGLAPRPIELTTSADTAGDPARVVGYGSFAVLPLPLVDDDDTRWLADLAARAIHHELRGGRPYPLGDTDVPEAVRSPGASFVTLERGAELVGCIGSLDTRRALWRDVARNARGAAFEDPRFSPLTEAERAGVTVEVSVLSQLVEVPAGSLDAVAGGLRPGIDGLVLASGTQRGTFLPDVWEKIPDAGAFVRELVRKAGWPDPWSPAARAWRYTTTTASTPLL